MKTEEKMMKAIEHFKALKDEKIINIAIGIIESGYREEKAREKVMEEILDATS